MLPEFHGLFRAMLDASVVWLAAVRGRCLGGGLELAAFCHRVVRGARRACSGSPRSSLGVFAPVASPFLPERVGPAARRRTSASRAARSTRTEALRMGLVDEVARRSRAAALAWARTHLLPQSASSLRLAVRALRAGWRRRFDAELAEAERLYLDDLMATQDARRGADGLPREAPARLEGRMSTLDGDLLDAGRRASTATGGSAPVRGVEGADRRPRDRLHARLRAARAAPRAGRAAGRAHGRRRRPRDHPRRRLLPVLHLPHPAQHDRAGAQRQPRLPRRDAVPGDLRRDPQPLGHVEAHVPGQARRATSTCRRTSTRRAAAPSGAARSRSCPPSSTRRGAQPLEPEALRALDRASTTRTAALVRGLYDLRREAPWKVPTARAVPAPARRARDPRRGAHGDAPRPTARRSRPTRRARPSTRRASCSPARSASSRRSACIKTLERSGCYIVDDDLVQVHRWIQRGRPADGRPARRPRARRS